MPDPSDRSNEAPTLPLAGRRVLDLGTAVAGPVCATILGDFGADIIKVERPGQGDVLRSFGPTIEGVPLWWMIEGRNKRSITLDISKPAGQDVARRLIAVCDVVVENFRPGTMKRWGLDAESVQQINPALVYVSVSGFGQRGPYSQRPAYDRVAQAMAGLTYVTGYPDTPPVKPGIGITDYTSAITAALGAVLALYARETGGGRGQQVDVALYESLLRMFHYYIPEYERTGRIPERTGNMSEAMVPAECFRTADGAWLMIAAGSDGLFARLVTAMGRPDLATDSRFATNSDRMQNPGEIHEIMRAWVRERSRAVVTQTLEDAGVPVAPLYTVQDIFDDPHFRERGSVVTVTDPGLGEVSMQGVVPHLVGTPGRIDRTGPALGEHNAEIYRDLLGLGDEEIRQLAASGVI